MREAVHLHTRSSLVDLHRYDLGRGNHLRGGS